MIVARSAGRNFHRRVAGCVLRKLVHKRENVPLNTALNENVPSLTRCFFFRQIKYSSPVTVAVVESLCVKKIL